MSRNESREYLQRVPHQQLQRAADKRDAARSTECVLIRQNVFSCYRMRSFPWRDTQKHSYRKCVHILIHTDPPPSPHCMATKPTTLSPSTLLLPPPTPLPHYLLSGGRWSDSGSEMSWRGRRPCWRQRETDSRRRRERAREQKRASERERERERARAVRPPAGAERDAPSVRPAHIDT